ncbi:Uncharacterised protein [Neisseria meningitidis]|nr:Uncharacterised protein [Neisseria meningitidis]CKK01783.1 Uncharacterised protein [Neisseria meningitidis]CKL05565.1 Uncharacterised protein [Neisseria meningitidis]
MNAGFGTQQTIGVFAFHSDSRAVDARDFAVVFFEDFDFEAFALGVAAVHTEQHTRPVFRFRTARACGDVDKAVVRVGGLVEHPFELQIRHLFFQPRHIFLHGGKTFFVVFFDGHFNQHAVVFDARRDVVERQHDAFEDFALFADFLGAFRVVPKFGVFGKTDNFFQSVFLTLIIHINSDVFAALFQIIQGIVELVDYFGFHDSFVLSKF